ncbi:MAG: hypothetical protein FJX66_16165 [Alphaproteobacteria bacterium]|nr:hypothetical protein [Alphaproteobacteria bacterium]
MSALVSVLSTGLSSFSNPSQIGPMYPGVGVEWLLVLILFLAWVIFHVVQFRGETKEFKEIAEEVRKRGVDNMMNAAKTKDDPFA